MIQQIALVSEASSVSLADLTPVAAAIQKQVTRDVSPLWGIQATVDCFDQLQSVPSGYWPIVLKSDPGNNVEHGIHEDNAGKPFALVRAMNGWELTASHEAIEMLIDPLGRRTVPGQSPLPGQGKVDFLVEVCDPCQTVSYTVNGISVSDFCTPNYFDSFAAPGVRYSFTGSVTAPRQVLEDGYLNWHDPITNRWFVQIFFGPEPQIIDVGTSPPDLNFRSFVYSKIPEAFTIRYKKASRSARRSVDYENVRIAAHARTEALHKQIAQLTRSPKRTRRPKRTLKK